MTESEWLQCADPNKLYMDRFATVPKPMRKLRLFACGCCRQIWEDITDPRCRLAVEVAEGYVDGLATDEQLDAGADSVEAACDEIVRGDPQGVKQTAAHAAEMALRAPSDVAHPVAYVMTHRARETGKYATLRSGHFPRISALIRAVCGIPYGDYNREFNRNLAILADLFRDVFGNPYRLHTAHPSWLTTAVKSVAQGIYDERAFERLGILADALEKAGCDDIEFLDHCRRAQVHVRGCWVLDLLLDKQP